MGSANPVFGEWLIVPQAFENVMPSYFIFKFHDIRDTSKLPDHGVGEGESQSQVFDFEFLKMTLGSPELQSQWPGAGLAATKIKRKG